MSNSLRQKQELQEELKKLMADTKELLGLTANVSDHAASLARTQVQERLQAVKEKIESGLSIAEDKAIEQLKVIDHKVRENPYKALGIGVGVGIGLGALIGLLIGRK
jgi:ElaB/YqjD/DUF883 family membrane-anchored ribosome-binding protein